MKGKWKERGEVGDWIGGNGAEISGTSGVGLRLLSYSLNPNSETVAAMKAARRGELIKAGIARNWTPLLMEVMELVRLGSHSQFGRNALGVPWSKGMRIASGNRRRVEAACRECNHRLNLFPCYMKLLDDFLDTGTRLKVFKHGSDGHPCIARNAAEAARTKDRNLQPRRQRRIMIRRSGGFR